MRLFRLRFSACRLRRSRAASRPRPGRPVWGRLQRAFGAGRRMARAGMVADYTRAENAERAAKWLG